MTIGETIKTIRVSQNVKSKDLAKILGVGHTYLSGIENNQRQPTLSMLIKISNHFNMPLSKIFLLKENNI